MDFTFDIIFFSTLAGLATILGIVFVLWFGKFAKKYSTCLISFAAGILITVTFMSLLPESIELNKNAMIFVLGGFLLFYLLEHFVAIHSCQEKDCQTHRLGIMGSLGIGFHSLIDGIAIGIGFEVSAKIGIITTLAVLFHKIPDGINSMAIMIHTKTKRKKAIIYSMLVALATPVGAMIALFLLKGISLEFIGALLAIAAGSFLYVGAADLLPETHKKFSKFNAVSLFLGVAFIVTMELLLH